MTTRPDPTSELERLVAAEAAVTPSAATRAANWAGLHARLAAAPASAASASGLVKLLVVAAVTGGAIAVVALRPTSPDPVATPAAPPGPAAPERAAPEPPVLEDRSSPAAPGDGSWDPELAHLQRVQAALRDGRPADARALVDEYGERWPDGVFLEEVEAARVLAACATARDAAARRTLAAFLRRWPESLYGARVRRSCDRP